MENQMRKVYIAEDPRNACAISEYASPIDGMKAFWGKRFGLDRFAWLFSFQWNWRIK